MKNIVIFASGKGTNAENIIKYVSDGKSDTVVSAIFTNNRKAGVLDIADNYHVNAFYFNRTAFYDSDYVLELLGNICPDLIILAGFLWKIPKNIILAFPEKIINIHPALLPKYGGKGMYGMHVHRAVVKNKEKETGITIHYVNAYYDKGTVIFQQRIKLLPTDTPEDAAKKVQRLEYRHFPLIIEKILYE